MGRAGLCSTQALSRGAVGTEQLCAAGALLAPGCPAVTWAQPCIAPIPMVHTYLQLPKSSWRSSFVPHGREESSNSCSYPIRDPLAPIPHGIPLLPAQVGSRCHPFCTHPAQSSSTLLTPGSRCAQQHKRGWGSTAQTPLKQRRSCQPSLAGSKQRLQGRWM